MITNGVYILQSLKNQRYYIGSTNSIERRIHEHATGLVSATKFLQPTELKLFIPCQTLGEARRAERRLKKYKSKKVIEKVLQSRVFPWEYQKL